MESPEGIRPLPGRHVTDHQMRLYMTFRQIDGPAVSAAKASISTATAYRYERTHQLPSSQKQPRGRRRPDPLVDFFDTEVVPMLMAAPGLRAVAIFEEMQRRHPGLSAGARRTLERRATSVASVPGARCTVPTKTSSSARSMSPAVWDCRTSATWPTSA